MSFLALEAARALTPGRELAEIDAKRRVIEIWIDSRATIHSGGNFNPFAVRVRAAAADSERCGETEAAQLIARAEFYLVDLDAVVKL